MKFSLRKNELDAIITLINCKNYGLAAKKLHMAQANLSRTITAIEDKLGLKIFERDTRPIKMTKFGNELLPLVIKNLEVIEELSSFTENYKKSLSECINIYAPSGIMLFLARHVLPKIQKARPEINIKLTTHNIGSANENRGISVMDDADITFTYSSPTNELLIAKKVATISANIYSTECNILKHPVSSIYDYAKYPCILLSEGNNQFNKWTFINKKNQCEESVIVSGGCTVDNYMTAVEIAQRNDFFILAPAILIDEMGAKDLKPTLPEEYGLYGSIYMVYKQKKHLPYRISVLTELISGVISEHFSM